MPALKALLLGKYTVAQIKKALLTAVGAVAAVLAAVLATGMDVIPDRYLPYVQGVIGLATFLGVFHARNADADPAPGDGGEAAVVRLACIAGVCLFLLVILAFVLPATAH